MGTPPECLGGMPVVAWTVIDARSRFTGATRHPVRGGVAIPPAALAICRDVGGGYYLFSCDGGWQTVADTWHETLDDAKDQAEFEYEGVSTTWVWVA